MKEQNELGRVACDTITGLTGVVVARTEWLYGCARLTLQPQRIIDGKVPDTYTFDEAQCVLVGEDRYGPDEAPDTGGPRPDPISARGPVPSRTHGRWIAIRMSSEDHLLTEDAARELVAALVAELAKPVGDALAESARSES